MKISQHCKFRLLPNQEQEILLNQAIGSARFVWNQILAKSFEMFAKDEFIRYETIEKNLVPLKKIPEFSFLGDTYSACLQQKIRDLATAWKKFYNAKEQAKLKQKPFKPKKPRFFKLADGSEVQLRPLMPRFKKKSDGEQSFRLPFQDCDVVGDRVSLPKKTGWIKFKKSQEIVGKITSVTIKKICGLWYISFCTNREVEQPIHPSKSAIGIDLGVKKLITTSSGQVFDPINSFKANQVKLARLQRKLRKKTKFSQNWKKLNLKINKLHHHIANIRHDYLHKVTTTLSKNHAMIVVEDLKVANMSKSAKGSIEKKGKNVKAKSGLNKSILDQGLSMLVDMLEYKQLWRGGLLVKIDPRYTSQTCSSCGHVAKENRQTQAKFECVECGFSENADINASCNILAAGHAVLSVEGGCGKGRPVKQKASEIREEVT
ncbi:RNA-guided endonuclease InsQ/TnpB family protein [Acinetobacter towneri]|uniref:IS200/IS605 family element transposase accessory protein TnpB n=1 Tax=Acinetobacter towneri TaxID=202956 RepID=A0AB35M2E6_9GAMM|nr:transposase [Acinetobacter towneri]MDM1719944.1 IS200/IS605 family element transposase accessory protein TnpB [Acinetobacter towneri]MDM1732027.1 IS200/IS605 family element transposase accessory protein TnpB [Acinetobacter towneri]MDM1734739.1 IS200/IS605 family element transposase accessory protein TnpB [Acinetobacter towneri]MDM1740020.1 IS200/IS605 family element transposase accessory protein TnpB [Acinetobacter towneri]MDM1742716.1 IS200/IS605 family element transposase accessory protei